MSICKYSYKYKDRESNNPIQDRRSIIAILPITDYTVYPRGAAPYLLCIRILCLHFY